MTEENVSGGEGGDFDVVICGAGLAGLTLAKQLRQEHPTKRVLLLEKTERPLPAACHKVGESSVEIGSSMPSARGSPGESRQPRPARASQRPDSVSMGRQVLTVVPKAPT